MTNSAPNKAPAGSKGADNRFHTRRLTARRKTLDVAFSANVMERVWRSYVQKGLRDQLILDLHDYYDFHRRRAGIFDTLAKELTNGRYAAIKSLPVRVEKTNGISRVLVIPAPEDAVVLQCIVESLYPDIRKAQPSQNAFFSRSHGFVAPQMHYYRDYIWFTRWREFSKRRVAIVTTHPYVCVTDIANYYDNIDYNQLRNVISATGKFDEVLLDILFSVLDNISWRPDYLPPSGRGLPQVDFDAPRLLAHVFLYEIDEFLMQETSDCFVRWVDDMSIAADSVQSARKVLRDLDELLMTRGLRLNVGKTKVLAAAEARDFFHADENEQLNDWGKRIAESKKDADTRVTISVELEAAFSKFVMVPPSGQWDKVCNRYLGLFSQLQNDFLLDHCGEWLRNQPSLRRAIFRYLAVLGPSTESVQLLESYLTSDEALDDASVFQSAHCMTLWEVEYDSQFHARLGLLGKRIGDQEFVQKSVFYFVSALWLLGKYGKKREIAELVAAHIQLWPTSSFLSRQVASILPKLGRDRLAVTVREHIERHKHASATEVLSHLDSLAGCSDRIPDDVRMYILNGKNKTTYSLSRFLICLQVLSSPNLEEKVRVSHCAEVLRYVRDPIYIRVIEWLKHKSALEEAFG